MTDIGHIGIYAFAALMGGALNVLVMTVAIVAMLKRADLLALIAMWIALCVNAIIASVIYNAI